jgi:hypothetical protein
MNRAAVEWLDARFNRFIQNGGWISAKRKPGWQGPSTVRRMIELRPIMAPCKPMHVSKADYADPERWWI